MADDWESQKENIKRLYVDEDLTCKQLVVQMKSLYGFERNVKEYQRHVRIWNFRKGLKQEEWRFVGRRIAKRKAEEGKESELIVNGHLFPQRKIRKALSRNFETTYENLQRQSVIRRSHTPEGIMIRTPRQRSPAACVYRRNLITIDIYRLLPSSPAMIMLMVPIMELYAPPPEQHILHQMRELTLFIDLLLEFGFIFCLQENIVGSAQFLLKQTRVGPNAPLAADRPPEIVAENGSLAMTLAPIDAGAHPRNMRFDMKHWIQPFFKKSLRSKSRSFLHKYPLDEPNAIPAIFEIGNVELIDLLLEKMIQKDFLPNSSVELALHWAIELKKMHLVDRITSSRFEFTPGGVFAAIYDNALHFVVMALERGIDANYVDGSGYSFLYTAISENNIPIANVLLQFGASVDMPLPRTEHKYLLIKAICEGLEDMVRLLLKRGADVHVRHNNGMSPLTYAILNRNYGIATYLVNWGADLERPSNRLVPTPLQIAAWNGDQHMVEMLLERNADVNACPPNFKWEDIGPQTEPMNGRTALANAIGGHSSEPLELVKLLIRAGADVNAMQGTPSSALYTAVQLKEESVVQFLLNSGASPADLLRFQPCDDDRQP